MDAAEGRFDKPETQCTHPAELHRRRNASDVTAVCPKHIANSVIHKNLYNDNNDSAACLSVK